MRDASPPAPRALIGPGSLLQGTIPADRRLRSLLGVRRLEAVVLTPAGDELVHYHRDQTRPDSPWVRGETITRRAAGPGSITQRAGRLGEPGELRVLVPEASGDAVVLAHFARASGGGPHLWVRVGEEPSTVPNAAAERVSVAPTALAGLPLIGAVAAALPGGDLGLAWPARRSGGRGWLQALVQEGASIYQWHRQEWAGRTRWVRAACLRFAPGDGFTVDAEPSVKVAQVTGERDSQPAASGATLSSSESRSGVRGTDLGVRVDHAGRTFLLFGDTHWTRRRWATLDAIGEVRRDGPIPGLPGVDLHAAPLTVVGGPATRREYDVPLDAFSLDGQLLGLFSSHHFARHQVMGRSLVTRAVDPALPVRAGQPSRPLAFRRLGTFSDRFFVNVSVQRRGRLLFVWGSGSYRADDLRLSVWDLDAPPLRDVLLGGGRWTRPLGGVRYWAGRHAGGGARWSDDEDEAAPILPGAFGELSVRWVPQVRRFALLAMAGPEDPIGPSVTLRSAPAPWGPWTPRRLLFDWVERGMSPHDEASRFIRAHNEGDPVGDAIFPPQRTMTGAAYAPYVYDTRVDGDDLVLRYTLSTWNPYQVVLMEHRSPVTAWR